MTQPSNTYAVNDVIGAREDLVDVIYDVSPTETPFLSMARKTKASAVNHEWQTDVLRAAAANYAVEGDDAQTVASVATVRLGNACQISDEVARTSGTLRAISTAGRADEHDYQVLKRAKELKRDMEFVLCDNNAKVLTVNDTTARELAGIPTWIITADSDGGGTSPTGDGTDAYVTGTARQFTEDMLKTVIKTCWDNGGEPDVLLMGSFNRQLMNSFGSGTKFQKVEDNKLHTSFDIYEGDFGYGMKIVPSRFTEADHVFGLQMEYWAVAFLRNMVTTEIAKTGDSDATQILCEYTLEARNEKSSFVIRDLTTS